MECRQEQCRQEQCHLTEKHPVESQPEEKRHLVPESPAKLVSLATKTRATQRKRLNLSSERASHPILQTNENSMSSLTNKA
jgi:hypothetical protein